MRFGLLLFGLLFFSSALMAQEKGLEIETFEAVAVATPETVTITTFYDQEGNEIKSTRSEPAEGAGTESLVPMIRAISEAGTISATAENAQREPVPVHTIKHGLFAIKGSGRIWVRIKAIDFDKKIFCEESSIVVGPDPQPDNPQPDAGGSLSDQVYAITQATTDKPSAATIAKVYRSVAGRAAGLSAMTAKGMAKEVRKQLDAKLSSTARSEWTEWAKQLAAILAKQNLGDDKPKTIRAFLDVARGVDRHTRSRIQPPAMPAVTPIPTALQPASTTY